jgi:hypothetical protein
MVPSIVEKRKSACAPAASWNFVTRRGSTYECLEFSDKKHIHSTPKISLDSRNQRYRR